MPGSGDSAAQAGEGGTSQQTRWQGQPTTRHPGSGSKLFGPGNPVGFKCRARCGFQTFTSGGLMSTQSSCMPFRSWVKCWSSTVTHHACAGATGSGQAHNLRMHPEAEAGGASSSIAGTEPPSSNARMLDPLLDNGGLGRILSEPLQASTMQAAPQQQQEQEGQPGQQLLHAAAAASGMADGGGASQASEQHAVPEASGAASEGREQPQSHKRSQLTFCGWVGDGDEAGPGNPPRVAHGSQAAAAGQGQRGLSAEDIQVLGGGLVGSLAPDTGQLVRDTRAQTSHPLATPGFDEGPDADSESDIQEGDSDRDDFHMGDPW